MRYKALNLFFITRLYDESLFRCNDYALKLLRKIENKAQSLSCNILRLNTLNSKKQFIIYNSWFEKICSI